MIPLDEARLRILEACEPLPGEPAPLGDAQGRRLVSSVMARHPYPNADVSAMDGYAVRASDADTVGARLPVTGESRAGAPFSGSLGPGEAIRIFTGAILPSGADTVVIQENTARHDQEVELLELPGVGKNIRYAGEGHQVGDELLALGTRIGPAAIGLLLSDGTASVEVHRRPRVAVLGTGDELLAPGEAPREPGTVVDGNGPMIAAFVAEHGGEAVDVARASDHTQAIAAWLRELAEEADLLVTTGGASVGEHDLIAAAWEAAGIETRFWKMAVKPGKPLRFGVIELGERRVPVLALPGNPLAVLTACEELVGPVLDRLSGGPGRGRPRVRVPLSRTYEKAPGRAHLVRGAVEDGAFVAAATQGSHLLIHAARGDAVAHVPAALSRLEAGAPIDVTVDGGLLGGERLQRIGASPRLLAVVGDSGAGKTRLVETLVAALRDRGKSVGTVKHATHEISVDTEGKDSWRHAQSGAQVVALVGPGQSAVFYDSSPERRERWLAPFEGRVSWVIIEGYRALPLPSVEVVLGEGDDLERLEGPEPRWRLTRAPGETVSYPPEFIEALLDD